ncbi:MAG TPA: hypothetical protein VNS09_22525 [Solirubrobacter sp.]|nr:hypothetical protein [Solirubrobacter sp.]
MRLEDFLRHFVAAAEAADLRFARTQHTGDIRAGIELWEQLADAVDEAPPELGVRARLAAAALYSRRFEVQGGAGDLVAARRELDAAREHIAPGSRADFQARMALAAWLVLRYRAEREPADLDAAIALWRELRPTPAGALAAANLGRALLARFSLTGERADLEEAQRLLGVASSEMPRDHPALPDVRLALRTSG